MFLATTGLKEFWDIKQDLLLLGEWCLSYKSSNENKLLKYNILNYLYNEEKVFSESKKYCDNLYEEYLVILSEKLNEIHNVNYSIKYWRIFIGPWFKCFIYTIYDRYLFLKKAFDNYDNLETILLDESSYIYPSDMTHFRTVLTSDIYNLQLYSQIIICFGYKFSTKKYNVKQQKIINDKYNIKKMLKNCILNFSSILNQISNNFSKVLIGDMYFGFNNMLKFIVKSNFRCLPVFLRNDYNFTNIDIDLNKRSKLLKIVNLNKEEEFETIMINLLYANFPKAYIEMYEVLKNNIKKLTKKSKIILDSVGLFANEQLKLLVAEKSAIQKTKIVCIQHGGQYGIGLHTPSEKHEIKISDNFFTWGWTKDSNNKVKGLSSPKITEYYLKGKKEKFSSNGDILYILNLFPRYLEYFRSVAVSSQVKYYLDMQIKLLNSFSKNVMDKTYLRLYMYDYGWYHKERILDNVKNIKLDNSKSLLNRFKTCRLIICSDNQTTFLQALNYNIPVILLLDKKIWTLKKEVLKYFNEFEEVGILYNEINPISKFIEKNIDNFDKWWFSDKVQNARYSFINNYAKPNVNWMEDWINQIKLIEKE